MCHFLGDAQHHEVLASHISDIKYVHLQPVSELRASVLSWNGAEVWPGRSFGALTGVAAKMLYGRVDGLVVDSIESQELLELSWFGMAQVLVHPPYGILDLGGDLELEWK